ncbi:MAG: glycosyltransferase family 1 protein [Oscillospiraceae bacterium]|nr:glycosyltransferase family 1 protein [Oscillospiraceae bacterium]
MKKVKALYFVDRFLRGGIQSFILDYASAMDDGRVQIEVLTLDDGKAYEMEKDLKQMRVPQYKLDGVWIEKPGDFIREARALEQFFAAHHDYDVVHLHSSSKNFLVLLKAKKYGIPVRIAHAHANMHQNGSLVNRAAGRLLNLPLMQFANYYFACSDSAAEWMFGKKNTEKGKVQVVSNAVDAERFKFDPAKRKKLRRELGLENKLVIGHVGRFMWQKNHCFIIDVFSELHKKRPDSVLVLAGDGMGRTAAEERVRRLGLGKSVRFLGERKDIDCILSAIDVFLFPSVMEGLGIAVIEAQAAGLPCFVSTEVPKKAAVSAMVRFLPLVNGPAFWSNAILKADLRRRNLLPKIKAAGYDIGMAAKKLEEFYIKSVEKNRSA